MSGLLYYVPSRPSISRADVERLGLGHLFEPGGPDPSVTTTVRGPDDGHGVVFSVPGRGDRGALMSPAADAAKWTRIEGGDAWLGFLEGERPGPRDLARVEQFAGHEVELADGKRWLVPVARLVTGRTHFPRKLARANGAWTEGVIRQPFAELYEVALRVWDTLTRAGNANLSLDEAAGVATSALCVNYRVGAPEIAALELLDTDVMVRVLRALVDWPAVEELGKSVGVTPS